MGEHHESVFLNDEVLVREAFVEFVAVLVDYSVEGNSDISKRNNDVTANVCIPGCLQDLEEKSMVLVTER